MTLRQAQQLINELAVEFKTDIPIIIYKRRRNGWVPKSSDYLPDKKLIRFAEWNIKTYTILHEFSHHLCGLAGREAHQIDFFFTLILVIDFYYKGNLEKYQWKHEYKTLQKYYKEYFCK